MARAWAAREKAYAPYSKFAVGAAAITGTGEIFSGCNVENVSFGLTVCAERVAISTGVAAGFQNFAGIALAADAENPVRPCGACRQFLAEFNPKMEIRSSSPTGDEGPFLLQDIFPAPFINFPRT